MNNPVSMCRWTKPTNLDGYRVYATDHDISNKYLAIVDGTIVSIVSQKLVAAQGINDADLELIVKGHIERYNICIEAEHLNTEDPEFKTNINLLAEKYTNNEFELQRLWKFAENKDFHAWFDFPHCTCPLMDNYERKGTPYGIVSLNCPIHGK